MKIGLIQYNPLWEDKESNKEKLSSLLDNEIEDVDLLVFPEMTLTGFTMLPEKYAENFKEESVKFFANAAGKFECNVIAGIIEKSSGKYFNTLIHLAKDGSLKNYYRKVHPFSYSEEDKYFSAGDNKVITEINDWKIGLSICYDLRFPELYRFYAKEKVHLIIIIASWPNTRIDHWRTLLKARAIENQCFVAGVNRVGDDPEHHYNGFSSLFDPMGKEIVAVQQEEKLITAEIEKNYVIEVRKKLPFLEDIRMI
jgi:predicted amidohydrolase